MASSAHIASEVIEGVSGPLLKSFGPAIGLLAAGALSLFLRGLVRNNERSKFESQNNYFAQTRKSEEAEFLARSQAENEQDR